MHYTLIYLQKVGYLIFKIKNYASTSSARTECEKMHVVIPTGY